MIDYTSNVSFWQDIKLIYNDSFSNFPYSPTFSLRLFYTQTMFPVTIRQEKHKIEG